MHVLYFAFSSPRGLEWLLVAALVWFIYFWIKTIIEILGSQKTLTVKIIWAFVIIFFSILGLLIYKLGEAFSDVKGKNDKWV